MNRISEILLVFSTGFEAEKIVKELKFNGNSESSLKSYQYNQLNIDVLITGIGIASTTYSLTKALINKRYDLVLNLGICGSFNTKLTNGTCVNVIQDEFADIGITETDNQFKSLFDETFMSENEFPFVKGKLFNNFDLVNIDLQKVKGITVNATSGNEEQIKMRQEKFKPDVESMEGAAVAFVCLSEGNDYVQIRSVSNPVELRDKDKWDTTLAINSLTDAVLNFLRNINLSNKP